MSARFAGALRCAVPWDTARTHIAFAMLRQLAAPAQCAGHPRALCFSSALKGTQYRHCSAGMASCRWREIYRRLQNSPPVLYSYPILRRRRRAAARRVRRTAPVRSACLSAAIAARVPDRIAST